MRTALVLVALVSLGVIDSAGGIDPISIAITGIGLVSSVIGIYQFADQLVNGDPNQELIIDSIEEIGRDIDSIIELIKDMDLAFERLQWSIDFETLDSLLLDITSPYDRFLFYRRNISVIERDTLLEFADAVLSHNPHSPYSAMYRLRDMVTGRPRLRGRQETDAPAPRTRQRRYVFRQGIFGPLESLLKASRLLDCKLDRSPQQVAFDLYSTVALVFAKAYSMAQFAYDVRRLFGEGSYTAESELLRQSYTNMSLAVALEASTVMRRLSPVLWRCDPARHERGTTYEEVTELLQGHLENEADLHSWRKCTSTCSDFSFSNGAWQPCAYPGSGYYNDPEEMYCRRQSPCKGHLYGCRYVAQSATVCLAKPGTHRRYNWIEYSSGHVKGRKDNASLDSCHEIVEAHSHGASGRCELCFCLCDDHRHSERYFSLRPVVSDIEDNKIVTGVRFVKRAGVFYIQLQQGVPDFLGYVNPSTTQWKPVGRRVDRSRDKWGVDYVSLSHERRGVLLQDLRGARGQVVTGVSFQFSSGHLSLKIRVTNIMDVLPALTPARSEWLTGSVPGDPPRLRLTSGPAVPTQSSEPSWPDSHSGQLVKFEASSFHLDAAQTTLPLLDVQPVAPRPAVWLAGVGLYHKKGHEDSGGFIGLRVEMADLTITEEDRKALVRAARRM